MATISIKDYLFALTGSFANGCSPSNVVKLCRLNRYWALLKSRVASVSYTHLDVYKRQSYNGPVYVRLGRAGVDDVTTEGYSFVPGKSTILVDGSDVTIIACGALVGPAVEASKTLSESNISARVINMASIKPIDAEAIIKAAAELSLLHI